MSVTPIPFNNTGFDAHEVVQALQDANATRYLSAVGVTVLLYDHILTFYDEVKLVWAAKRSFAKYAFLLNRYLVLACLLGVSHEMCGFAGDVFTDTECRKFIFTCSMLSLCSVGIANILVLMRVVILWDHRPIILKLLSSGFVISLSAQIAMMVWTMIQLQPGLHWNSMAGMCVTTTTTPTLIAVWASPMLFEVLVLFFTVWNALDRPQQAELPLTKALYRDGVSYFLAVTCFRVLNLTLSIKATSSLTMLGVFFVWAMTTTILNRSLLRMRRAEVRLQPSIATVSGRASPFGVSAMAKSADIERPRWIELHKLRSL